MPDGLHKIMDDEVKVKRVRNFLMPEFSHSTRHTAAFGFSDGSVGFCTLLPHLVIEVAIAS